MQEKGQKRGLCALGPGFHSIRYEDGKREKVYATNGAPFWAATQAAA